MSISVNQTSTLLGGTSSGGASTNIYDLVTGSKKDLTSSVLSGVVGKTTSNLSQNQTDSFSSLEDFITENLSGDEASKLLTSLNALRKLTELGNSDKAALDPVYSILAKNKGVTQGIPSGSVVSEVA